MNRIIAFVDGSPYSTSVCEHAAWIAGARGSSVEILHVLGRREGGPRDLSGNITLGARTSLLERLADLDAQQATLAKERGRAILEDAEKILRDRGVTGVTARLRHGDIVQTVTEAEDGADLILIGKRGEAADFAKGHLGSNLERIVRASTKPVLVAARAFRPVQSVLIAWDGGASSQKAVRHVAQDALFRGMTVRLVTVGQGKGLEKALSVLTDAGMAATAAAIPGQPETALAALIEAEGFDLLVMGAYGHSQIRSLIIGSTTTAMIRSCKVPVLLIR